VVLAVKVVKDEIDVTTNLRWIEEKDAVGLRTANPRTGLPQQTVRRGPHSGSFAGVTYEDLCEWLIVPLVRRAT
jgi:hypothetical protein